jgi:DNA polymerase V
MTTLRELGPNVEVYSIDEMFLDLQGLQEDWQGYGRKIRMPVGVGIAPSKTLAKLANRSAEKIPKCDGVYASDTPEKWQWVQRRTAVFVISIPSESISVEALSNWLI